MIRVLLLDDVRLHREGLAALLARDARLRVTALAPSAVELRQRAAADVVIVANTAGGAAAASVQAVAESSDAPIVALGIPDDEQDVIALAELGVVGFVEREASLDDLVASVLCAARGEASLPPRIATTLLRRVTRLASRREETDVSALTIRERQVVRVIAEGLSNKEIATRLCIEVATVKNHVHNILEKLQVSRRSDAVARLRIVEGDRPADTRSTTRSMAG